MSNNKPINSTLYGVKINRMLTHLVTEAVNDRLFSPEYEEEFAKIEAAAKARIEKLEAQIRALKRIRCCTPESFENYEELWDEAFMATWED